MKQVGIKIEGTIYTVEGNLGLQEFINEFLNFVESKGWHFAGGSCQVSADVQQIKDIDD